MKTWGKSKVNIQRLKNRRHRKRRNRTLMERQAQNGVFLYIILACTALVGSICFIQLSTELLLLPSRHNISTSYTWDCHKLTCKVYVGVRMCVCVFKSMWVMKAFKTRMVFMMQHESSLRLCPLSKRCGRKAIHCAVCVYARMHVCVDLCVL